MEIGLGAIAAMPRSVVGSNHHIIHIDQYPYAAAILSCPTLPWYYIRFETKRNHLFGMLSGKSLIVATTINVPQLTLSCCCTETVRETGPRLIRLQGWQKCIMILRIATCCNVAHIRKFIVVGALDWLIMDHDNDSYIVWSLLKLIFCQLTSFLSFRVGFWKSPLYIQAHRNPTIPFIAPSCC